jgi:hypothetical protein
MYASDRRSRTQRPRSRRAFARYEMAGAASAIAAAMRLTWVVVSRTGRSFRHSSQASSMSWQLIQSAARDRHNASLGRVQLPRLFEACQRGGQLPLPAATTAAASSVAESSAAPIAHHQKKANTDATSSPNPRPATKAPALANQGRRVSAASSPWRRCQRPPASSPVPASKGTSATTSTSDNPCPGLIGIRTGPSRAAGTTNSINASANKIPHQRSHFITALGAATGPAWRPAAFEHPS